MPLPTNFYPTNTPLAAGLRTAFRSSTRPLALSLLCIALNCHAIVDAYSAANTNAPSDGAPWANVASVNGASGIYVGAGWVLTAAHVGAGNTILAGATYQWDGRWQRLTNSDGSFTDLGLFHLKTLPPLSRLNLATTTPPALSQVDLIACGRTAGSAETTIGAYQGFYWSAAGRLSWGNNKVNQGGLGIINAGLGNVTVGYVDFTNPTTVGATAPTSDECSAAVGDSGGAVFRKNGSIWQLVGMIDAVGTFAGQAASTSVYGNVTYWADIATYRPQIVATLQATAPALTISRNGSSNLITWPDNGVTYTLRISAQLPGTTWSVVAGSPQLANGSYSLLVPATNTAGFYRLQ